MSEKMPPSTGRIRRRTHLRAAFSLAEIVVALTIIGVVTAMLLVNVGGYWKKAASARLVEDLTTLATAVREFDRQVGRYPQKLTSLYKKPGLSDNDICGTSFPQSALDKWRGPYLGREFYATGLVIETDTIDNGMVRAPASPGNPGAVGELQIDVRNVSAARALEIDELLDGDGVSSTGPVEWNSTPGYPQLVYAIRITGC